MKIKNTLLTILAGVIATISVDAQTKFYLDGLGRAVIENDKMDDGSGILAADTIGGEKLSTVRSTNGYALFDLGVNVEKGEKFRAIADLRVRNEFGLFYGEGASLEFRRMLLEGIIGKGIKYELGDIDVMMTPFTVYNNGFMDNGYEADVFQIRRDVLEYENFNNGNNWRLQGAQTYGKVLFAKGIESISFKGFASRTNKTDFNITPDKVLAGANVTIDQGSIAKLGINYTGALDVPLASTTVNFTNSVISFAPEIGYDISEDLRIAALAEYAISKSGYSLIDSILVDSTYASQFDLNGSALDAKLQVEYSPWKLKFKVGFRNVTKDFVSPSAQTRRVNYQVGSRTAQKFGEYYVSDETGTAATPASREINLYDRLTQESVYNQSIYGSLMSYNPIYGNTNPYGLATPNRSGVYVELNHGDEESPFNAQVSYNSLSEIESTDGAEYREFTLLGFGLKADFKKLFSLKKEANVVFGYNSESTVRAGANAVDLSSTMINAGLTLEVANKLDVLAGAKIFSAEGNELSYTNLNLGDGYSINQVDLNTAINEVNYKVDELIYSFGLRARFTENSFVTVNYNLITYTDDEIVDPVSMDYNLSQLYMNYTIKF